MIAKIFLLAMSIFLVLAATTLVPALAAPQLEPGLQIGSSQCNLSDAQQVIHVTQKVLNDNDNGLGGNTWAFDSFTRDIHVWQEQDGSFCAVLIYHGKFDTIAGSSPSGSSTISGEIQGTFSGEEITTVFSGTLSPQVPTHGFIGTYDYKCNTDSKCPGYVKWQDLFFTNLSGLGISKFEFKYYASVYGTWLDSSLKNSGDITG